MKTKMNQLAVAIFAFLLLVGNVGYAEGTNTKASSHELITEEPALELEAWMTNPKIWDVSILDFTAEKEQEMKLENWMTDPVLWANVYDFSVEKESGLGLEDWMLKENTWNIFLLQPEEAENSLKIEQWMVNENNWKINS